MHPQGIAAASGQRSVGIRPSATLVANAFNLHYWGKSITAHTACNWLIGKSTPMQNKLRLLADWLQVSPDELRFGAPAAPRKSQDWDDEGATLSLQDREMLKRYLSFPNAHRKTGRDVVTALAVAASVSR